ncbi:hypothetical protein [Sulfobacillus thermosulfidooxidans]|uniref:hypothetical protein n=1 Tax=Sulfobacillus thermosulfidooxidans TaxID=28034 RepID=UPI000415C3D7|nr:hypothetical protein [Sulfobacillus thermosulfidooxidans]
MTTFIRSLIPFTTLTLSLPFIAACSTISGPAPQSSSSTKPVILRTMVIRTGKEIHRPGWPQYQPAFWSAPQNSVVKLTIISHDSGASPLMMTQNDQVRGTVGGIERIDGKKVTQIANNEISHTFTIPALGINLPIPVAPPGKTVTVTAEIPFHQAGSYLWQCMAPCATSPMGMGGAMVTPGYMRGTITITNQ